jgi:hypothetical protein
MLTTRNAVTFNAGARALSAVKFDGISETHWQGLESFSRFFALMFCVPNRN